MGIEKQSHESAICGASKKRGGICQAQAGKGTDHLGSGRCKHHGGNAGAPPGNKNALKTGRYESILVDALDADERALFEAAATAEKLRLLEEEIALTTIRERRMLHRIAALKAVVGGMSLVEESTEIVAGEEPKDVSERLLSQLDPDDADELAGGGDDKVTRLKQKRTGTLGQIQQIEQDLTAVQGHKARLIKLLHDLGEQAPGAGRVEVSDARQRLADRLLGAQPRPDPGGAG